MNRIFVAWTPHPNRDGGYSYQGVKNGGGKIIKEAKTESEANNICSKLNTETKDSAGGYIVVFGDSEE